MMNHGQIAQARRDFLNGIKFQFNPTDGKGPFIVKYDDKRNELINDGKVVATVINVKDQWFDIKASHSMGFNRHYFAHLKFLPGISKQDFTAGRYFKYCGHFQTLTRHKVYYDAMSDQLIDETAKLQFDLVIVDDAGFKILKSGHGTIRINFNECELKEATTNG